MTEQKLKNEQCEDLIIQKKEEHQQTMDKMSLDSSVAHTYNKVELKDDEDCEDIVIQRKKQRQQTMDKMSLDPSVAHTYDKNRLEDGEKCS